MVYIWSSLSNAGGRRYNEDYFTSNHCGPSCIWIVADGMGGHNGGELASKLAVDSILEQFLNNNEVSKENTVNYLLYANDRIIEMQTKQAHLRNMQTTIVIAVADDERAVVAHIGDSRCYLFRNGRVEWQTKDHSVVEMLVKLGEIDEQDIRSHEDRNKVLKSLGKERLIKPSVYVMDQPLQTGDAFLLCTDGFWEYVLETEMEIDFFKSDSPEQWLKRMETRLLSRAKKNHDNYTAIAVFSI